jgi:signal transduction histidine kinase
VFNRFFKNLRSYKREKIDPSSLQFRLTLGVASISLLGLGGMAIWTNWKMQSLVYSPHALEIVELAGAIPSNVELQESSVGDRTDLQQLIDQWSMDSTWLWVRQADGKILAHSSNMPTWMMDITQINARAVGPEKDPKIKAIGDHFVAICSQEMTVNGQSVRMFLARDITSDYKMWLSFAQTLGLATAFTILGLSGVSGYLIRRSLKPLRKTCDQACATVNSQPEHSRLDPTQMPGEVKQLVQNWNRMIDQVSKTGEQQRLFTSGISHELRTPLSLVYGYLQSTLRRGNNLTPQQQEALKIAAAETEHTIKLLQDLLDLARVDCGTVQLRLEPISLNDTVIIMAETKGDIHDRKIEVNATHDPIMVQADAHYLTEVMGHLLDNAIQFSSAPITISLSKTDAWAILKMRDRGVGIPEEQLDQIFEPFYRVDPSRARSTGGVGLGLAIVKTLVSRMGGHVSVTSSVGEGSTFEIQLPNARSAS